VETKEWAVLKIEHFTHSYFTDSFHQQTGALLFPCSAKRRAKESLSMRRAVERENERRARNSEKAMRMSERENEREVREREEERRAQKREKEITAR